MNSSPLSSGSAFDIRSLDSLKRTVKTDSQEGLKAAAKQMEGLFVQMMLKSMRDASFKDGLFNSQQSQMFTSMYDQQLSQDIASQGRLGFADMMVKQMGGQADDARRVAGHAPVPLSLSSEIKSQPLYSIGRAMTAAKEVLAGATSDNNKSFISRLMAPAMAAAKQSGIPHQLIIAQAALESGWGNREIMTRDGKPSHNLFAVKATAGWKGDTTEVTTTEYVNGVAQKVKAAFRVYPSYSEALADYAKILTSNPRYQNVTRSASAENAAHALQSGGYATDPAYAKKLINIINQVKGSVNQAVKAYQDDLNSLF